MRSKPNFEIDKKDFTIIGNDSAVKVIGNENFRGMPRHFFFFPQVLHSVTINVIILFLCELVVLYFRKQKIENENARLRQSNLEAKNNQLKMQLHPHFLFNSLNTLRLLLKKDADKAEDYLLKLSEMLRFSTTSALHDTVDVADELKLCLAYLQMQKVRFGDMLHYNINNPALFLAIGKLPVYSLQLLVENAIKHNAFYNRNAAYH
ncbi:MAG: histidine kinase [Ferruginibacter sp.]